MTHQRLTHIDSLAEHHKVAIVDDVIAGFLLVLREGTAYGSENYRWLCERVPQFLYVDRIVIDPAFARRGVGAALYDDLFAYARQTGVDTVTCEYNIEPPNDASQAFHDRFGFQELGRERVAGGEKLVSYQSAPTALPETP